MLKRTISRNVVKKGEVTHLAFYYPNIGRMLPRGDTWCQKSIKPQKMKCLIFLIFHDKRNWNYLFFFSSFRMREPNYGEQNRFVFAWAKSTLSYHINMRYMSQYCLWTQIYSNHRYVYNMKKSFQLILKIVTS